MAVTILFNGLKGLSQFWLWRIDAAREKIDAEVRERVGDVVSHAPTHSISENELPDDQQARAAAQDILSRCDAPDSQRAPRPVVCKPDERRDVLSLPTIADGRYGAVLGRLLRKREPRP
jgi:hypothetical protein